MPYFIDIATNRLFAGRRVAGGSQIASFDLALNAVSANAWHHVAASFQNSSRRLTLYFDGVQVAQVNLAGTSMGNTSPVSIGRNGGSTPNFWTGKLDDLRIWNVVRTAVEIQSNFNAELSGAPASLVGNWRFNEGTGSTASDSAGTPQNASLLGGAAFSGDTPWTTPATPTPTATATTVPPTATATNVPPTATSLPPTATATSVPPTATATSVPPTASATPTTGVPTATPTTPVNNLIVAPTPSTVVPVQPVFAQPVQPVYTTIWLLPRRQNPTRTPVPTAAPTSTPEPTSVLLPPPPGSRLRALPPAGPAPVVLSEDWLLIMLPVQTYTVDMEPLRMGEPGEWYRVGWTEEGYALALLENDSSRAFVWIGLDAARVRRVVVEAGHARPEALLWFVVSQAVEVNSVSGEPVAFDAGARYVLLSIEGDYALITREDDTELRLWMRLDSGIEVAFAGSPS